uniref:Si:dkey-93h22.7 n=1 Tax=Cyprinus carpio carpio TaxID=630221 RepID=A0A9J7XY73_CYPCA
MELMHLTLILIGPLVLFSRMGALEKLDEPVLFGPLVGLEGSAVDFFCEIPGKLATLSVHYELYAEKNPSRVLGEYSSLSGELATISQVITTKHDGRLICKASGHNNTDIESSISKGLDFRVIVPVAEVMLISHPSSDYIWEGQTLTLQCKKTKGTVSAQNTGDYMCVASNQYNDTTTFNTSSNAVTVNVKEYVSKPKISFDVAKNEDGGFTAIITCQSTKGTPLKFFTLLNYTEVLTTESTDRTSVLFSMPIELNRYMGQMRCNASNEGNWVLSDPLSLTVESVGGAVTVTPLKHVGLDFQVVGMVLRCKVERGTFPHYSWFLNNSRLLGRGGFYSVAWSDESVLALSVGQDSAGLYHCQASDRFDNSTSIRSPEMLISKEALNTVSPLVVIVVFTSFALLNLAVIACCIYGVVLRRRYSRKYPLTEQHRKMGITDKDEEDEDYLFEMLEGYEEDVVQSDRLSNSAEDEDQSVDESVLYEGAVSE